MGAPAGGCLSVHKYQPLFLPKNRQPVCRQQVDISFFLRNKNYTPNIYQLLPYLKIITSVLSWRPL